MAQADILIADERLLPQAVDLYNSIFRPKRELDFFTRHSPDFTPPPPFPLRPVAETIRICAGFGAT